MKMQTIRRISQILFLGLFLYLILKTAYPLTVGLPVDLFGRLDPLIAGASMLASRSFIRPMMLSLVIVGLTLLLGRVFCGWICPLGTTLDASDKLFFRSKKRLTPHSSLLTPHLKYYILVGLAVSALFSMQAVYLLDPLSLLTRTIVIVFVAPVQIVIRALAQVFYGWSGNGLFMWLSDRMSSWPSVAGPQLYFRQAFIVMAIFVGIVSLNSLSRRFWCRNLCPLGALLGLLSFVPILRRVVGDCNDCTRCATDCKMAAIHEDARLTRTTECVECFNCVNACNRNAVAFRFFPPRSSLLTPHPSLSLSRRRVLQGAGVGLAIAAVAAIDPGRKVASAAPVRLSSPFLIRPPGSVPEDQFVDRCTRCGACMKVCPTNGLQPAIHEAGLEGFWTSILVPRIGCCTQECNACGEVCPTDAILPFKIADKPNIFIGRAIIDRSQCIAWNADKKCLVCDEYCSYTAIEWKVREGFKRPFVDEKKCTGCGICESACPIQPVAAIRVYSLGDKRSSS